MDGKLIIENRKIATTDKITSINPATEKPVDEVYLASSKECQTAIQAALKSFPSWKEEPIEKKQKILLQAKKIILQRREEIAHLITSEKGSPLAESLSVEILGSLEALDFYAKRAKKSLKPKKVKHHVVLFLHKKSSFHFQPLGPTLIISPWNFSFLIPFYEILSSLISGNTVVFRPSTSTPLTGLLIGEILIEAGLPPGVLNVVNCRVAQAEEMITNPDIQTISFTGSVSVGKRIMELASQNLTNIVLELGGKDPMVVLSDANLERASRGAVWGAFMNCGQSCGSVERLYVAREVSDEFIERVLEQTKKLKVGNPLEPGIDMGPMTTIDQLKVVEDHILDAREKGARIVWGGKRVSDSPGYFIQPTILTHVDHNMKIMQEETFGPVLPIMTFSDPQEAVALANDSVYGLTASVWTRDKKMATSLAEKIEAGSITVNDHMFSFSEPAAIWGGIKNTGIGRSHGTYGLLEQVNTKFISHDFSKKRTQIWWYPYESSLFQLLDKSLTFFYHDRIKEKLRSFFSLIAFMPRIIKGSPLRNFIKSFPRMFKR